MWRLSLTLLAFMVAVLAGWRASLPLAPVERKASEPSTKSPAGPSPSLLLERRSQLKPPPLTGTGEAAQQSVASFIDWAAGSTEREAETARRLLAAAREEREVAQAFCDQALRAREADHSRALVALALLGEIKSPVGEKCFTQVLALPLPTQGTVVEGEILEQTALATLQAKAVDGLAYLGTPSAQEEVLRLVRAHPSRIVRAEAIDAYLWNHADSVEAKATLRKYVQKGEEIFVDRVRRNTGEKAESFNAKLAAFLKAHPEVRAPAPEKVKEGGPAQRAGRKLPPPPKF